MGVASNYASQYKRRLLEDGVIGERRRGLVGFDIPAFREFLSQEAFLARRNCPLEHRCMAISNPSW